MALALAYDEVTGTLSWVYDRPRAPAGSLAGYIHRDGNAVVKFEGRPYQAHHIAWFFKHGVWPSSQVLFKDKDALNIAANNLYLQSSDYSPLSSARASRNYRANVKRRTPLFEPTPRSSVEGVRFKSPGFWEVRARWMHNIVIGEFGTQLEAENAQIDRNTGYLFVQSNPPPIERHGDDKIFAGDRFSLNLREARALYAYDPETGRLYYRWTPIRIGADAVEITSTKRPIVRASGRSYTAGMVAWFIVTGTWPKRKQLRYRDDNPQNIKFSNLYLKDESPDEHS